jgi:redox-sensing transcriptional repressor
MIPTSRPSIRRLSEYRALLKRLYFMKVHRVASHWLAEKLGFTAAQVRKDFSQFNITGHKRGGYEIAGLLDQINNLLGKFSLLKVVVAGAGNIGTALSHYDGFKNEQMEIVGLFDTDPAKWRRSGGTPVYPLAQMPEFIRHHKIRLGIICVPAAAAQEVCTLMVKSGIQGILNFAPVKLKTPESVMVHKINLVNELEYVAFFLQKGKETGE